MYTNTSPQTDDQLQAITISEAIATSLKRYFAECGNQTPTGVYDLVKEQVEAPLLKILMEKYHNNQSKVSVVLGLSRGTTRTLLKKYGFIN